MSFLCSLKAGLPVESALEIDTHYAHYAQVYAQFYVQFYALYNVWAVNAE